ncbi:MAG: DegV family protein [Gemmatimonadota bacterium]|nr:DegV family protein [Gemmatimonadota bacterium]
MGETPLAPDGGMPGEPARPDSGSAASPEPGPAPTTGEGPSPRRIAYLDGRRLRRVILAGVRNVRRQREELDRINVFPVPDGDTGTNLALTLSSVAEAVRPLESRSLSEVAERAAEASVLAARGNSGMLFSRFLLGFASGLRDQVRAGSSEVAEALTGAAAALQEVLERPREGTIITVARDMAAEARRRTASGSDDFHAWLHEMQDAAERSLQRTRDMLPALRQAGVVDAGAKGFVSFFEGILHYIEGKIRDDHLEEAPAAGGLYFARQSGVGADEGRYCTQVAIRGGALPPEAELRAALGGQGTSLIVLRAGDLAKVHVHADRPEEVVATLSRFGEVVSERIEDTSLAGATTHVAVVVDSSCDLPHEWTERHGVAVVPLQVVVGDISYRDGVDIDAAALYDLIRREGAPEPSTSQPAPAAFAEAYRRGIAGGAESVLGIFLSSAVSGTYGAGAAALRDTAGVEGAAFDSRSGSLGAGLLAVRAVELLDEGRELPEVLRELERVRARSNILFTVETLEYLARSGRIGRARAWLGERLDLKPILSLSDDGRLTAIGRVRGSEAVLERVLGLLDERLLEARRYRLGVAHFAAAEMADRIVRELETRYDPVEILAGPATAVLGVHVGPGAWAVAYQIED